MLSPVKYIFTVVATISAACGSRLTPYSPENTRTADDLVFLEVPDLATGRPTRFFAVGYDTHSRGPWDGVTGEKGCYVDENGQAHGFLDNAAEMNRLAFEAGANFAYVWSGADKLAEAGGKIYGIWHDRYGERPPPEKDVVPVFFNGAGEADMESDKDAAASSLRAKFEAFRERRGDYSPEKRPTLPPFDKMPYFAWHPTWRIRGGGDGTGELCSDAQADAFASATNMMIGDNYTYVVNRWPGILNPITGQKGEEGEGYDLWLERDDPDHRSYFSAAWNMIHSAVTRARRLPADSQHPTVVWAWLQGHAFDDDIGRNVCFSGSSDLWAKGPFPTLAYLRKEICSTIVAGGTGIIFFGYMYCRFQEAEKVRLFFRALSHPEVYQPVLLSPRLLMDTDLTFHGEPGYDGKGRAHLLAKWHESSRTAYLIVANPGARPTSIDVKFPWSIHLVEVLHWGDPASDEVAQPQLPRFLPAKEAMIDDRRLVFTAPRDEGLILRITPVYPEGNLSF